ncbi:MAG: pyridoxamine 5'-phosphate oxidase [Ignavibacteriales bacterium]|nr:pyridoxamine 5'-phosphate oxidase [Ignavibacteriales bacterium]
MSLNMENLRKDYKLRSLDESSVDPDPILQLTSWMNEALQVVSGEASAMSLSTVSPEGRPSARIVSLKKITQEGLFFFTNYQSKKGRHIEHNPYVSALLFWGELERQIRIEGKIFRANERISDEYFSNRPYESRISAIVSPQSDPVPGRKFLEDSVAKFKLSDQEVKRPYYWGGYLIVPDYIEFWQGRENRLHDRVVYKKSDQKWMISRVAP